MKSWLLIRKTLKSLGFTSLTAENVKVDSIDSDATVHFTEDDAFFSGNIASSETIKGINVDEVLVDDNITSTFGTINIMEGSSVTYSSDSSGHYLTYKTEYNELIDVTLLTFLSSNSHVNIDSNTGEITTVDVGSSTITVSNSNDHSVFSKIKIYVTE